VWVLLSSKLRTWVLLSVAVPLVSRLLRTVAASLEKRTGRTVITRVLAKAGDLTGRVARKGASKAATTATDAASGQKRAA
jgi:hypothetical protein